MLSSNYRIRGGGICSDWPPRIKYPPYLIHRLYFAMDEFGYQFAEFFVRDSNFKQPQFLLNVFFV